MITPTSPKDYDNSLIKLKLQKEVMNSTPLQEEYRSFVEHGLKESASACKRDINITIVSDGFNMERLNALLYVLKDYELVGWFCYVKHEGKTNNWMILMYRHEYQRPNLNWWNNLINKIKNVTYYIPN